MAEELENLGFNLDEFDEGIQIVPTDNDGVKNVALKGLSFEEKSKDGKTTRAIVASFVNEKGHVANIRFQDPTSFPKWGEYDLDKKRQLMKNFGVGLKHIVQAYYPNDLKDLNAGTVAELCEVLKSKLPSDHATIFHPRVKFIVNENNGSVFTALPTYPPFIDSKERPVAKFPFNPKYDIFEAKTLTADGAKNPATGGSGSAAGAATVLDI